MSEEIPVREHDKFMLRLPPGMREELSQLAKRNRRSMNAEIVSRLRGSIDRENISEEMINETRAVDEDLKRVLRELQAMAKFMNLNIDKEKIRIGMDPSDTQERPSETPEKGPGE